MPTTIRIDSFNESNIVERTELSVDYVDDALAIDVRSTQGLAEQQAIYIGSLSREGIEKAVIASIVDETTIALTEPLKLPHARYEAVTAVLGDSIHIYRAPNVDGSVPDDTAFTVLVTRLIDPDQQSTYYRDSTGSSAFWYRHTYFNPTTNEETSLTEFDAYRGDDFEHYASLSDIRNEAGFKNAFNLADSDIELQRRNAEAEINASLSSAYTVPFKPVPEIVQTLTIKLASAMLLVNAYGSTPGSTAKLKEARLSIDSYKNRDSVLTDDSGNALGSSDTVTGWPDESAPRSFRIGDNF